MENSNIDYDNIFNHCDAQEIGEEIFLEEKGTNNSILKFDIKRTEEESNVDFWQRFGEFYCEFIRKTENRTKVKNWFREKYN